MLLEQNNIWWAFCEYDKDGDGRITAAELRLALKVRLLSAVLYRQ
jgi:Ca2+-binding EF-hand superfamily protein